MTITVTSEHPHNAGSINENDVAVAIRRALGRDRGVTVSLGRVNVLTEKGWIEHPTPEPARRFLQGQMLNRRAAAVTFDLDLRPESARTRADHDAHVSRTTTIRVLVIIGTAITAITIIS